MRTARTDGAESPREQCSASLDTCRVRKQWHTLSRDFTGYADYRTAQLEIARLEVITCVRRRMFSRDSAMVDCSNAYSADCFLVCRTCDVREAAQRSLSSMAQVANCPQCEHELLVPDGTVAGSWSRCPNCRAFFQLERCEAARGQRARGRRFRFERRTTSRDGANGG